MNVLHFSTSDIEGGSARSAWRIHQGLKLAGVQSRMLVGTKLSASPDVASVARPGWRSEADTYCNIVLQKLGLQYRYVPSSNALLQHPWIQEADIFQLFNTHGGYFATGLLAKLARRAPIVWRLSDLWPLTGHCAYPGQCTRWLAGCGECPDLATYPPIGRDTTGRLWRLKKAIYERCDITVIAPSSWTQQAAERSPLFAGRRVCRVPNGIDQTVFAPRDRNEARSKLGIATDRRVVFFSAHVAFNNPRKGSDLLRDALNLIGQRKDVILLVAGRDAELWRGQVPVDVVSLGFLTADEELVTAYAAADVVCVPSSVENLPNTVLEAMACARAVVAIDAGGMRDAVLDGDTGILCPPKDPVAFARAIVRLLDFPEVRKAMAERALAVAKAEFSVEREVSRIHTVYREVLERAGK